MSEFDDFPAPVMVVFRGESWFVDVQNKVFWPSIEWHYKVNFEDVSPEEVRQIQGNTPFDLRMHLPEKE